MMHLKSKHFTCTRFLGSAYFVLRQQFYGEKGGSDAICWGWVRVTWGGGVQTGAAGRAARRTMGVFGSPFPQNSREKTGMFRVKAVLGRNSLSLLHAKPSTAATFPYRLLPRLASPHHHKRRQMVIMRQASELHAVNLPAFLITFLRCITRLYFHPPFYRQQLTRNSSQPFSRARRRETRVWSNAEGHD